MKYWIIVKNNIKKSKVSCIIILLLVSMATMLTVIAANVISRIENNYRDIARKTNVEDVFIMMPEIHEEKVEKTLGTIEQIAEYEKDEMIYFPGSSIQNLNTDKEAQDMAVAFLSYDIGKDINILDIVEHSETQHENGIYLPYYLAAAEGFRIADEIEIKLEDNKYVFTIDGFYQDVNNATPSNVTMYCTYIYEDRFDEIYDKVSQICRFSSFRLKADETITPNELEIKFSDEFKKQYNISTSDGILYNAENMIVGGSMYPKILMFVLFGFSIILIIIAIVIIRFSIVTHIEQNYKNLGVMEAAGYTSWNLAVTLILQFLVLSITGSVLGIGLAVISRGFVADILEIASGIKWSIVFSTTLVFLVVAAYILLIVGITALISLRIRKLSVLNVLRDGIYTHNFRKNHIPLDRTNLPLNTALGLKSLLMSRKQNMSIGLIISALVYFIVMSMTMYTNFKSDNKDNDAMWDFIGLDRCDIAITSDDADVREKVSSMEGITDIKEYTSMSAKITKDDKSSLARLKITADYSGFSEGVILDGRFPKHENEISLTARVAEEIGVKIDNTVVIETETGEEEFLVVGLTQQLNNLGKGACITLAGIRRIISDFEITSVAYVLAEGTDPAEFIDKANMEIDEGKMIIMNNRKIMSDMLSTYEMSMGMLSIMSLATTFVIICMVLFLLVNIKTIRDKRKNGVYKALGYTTGQLVWQTVISFVPSIIIGCIIGLLLGVFGTNPVIALMLSGAGIKSCSFVAPITVLLIIMASLILTAILVAVLTALRIRKVTPNKMLTDS